MPKFREPRTVKEVETARRRTHGYARQVWLEARQAREKSNDDLGRKVQGTERTIKG